MRRFLGVLSAMFDMIVPRPSCTRLSQETGTTLVDSPGVLQGTFSERINYLHSFPLLSGTGNNGSCNGFRGH